MTSFQREGGGGGAQQTTIDVLTSAVRPCADRQTPSKLPNIGISVCQIDHNGIIGLADYQLPR